MTPPARLQAAIDVLSQWFAGVAIEKALTNWARGARYAGSKDRAAVRDIVFDCLRKRLYFQTKYSLPDSARGLVIAHALSWDAAVGDLFAEGGYGPEALSPEEVQQTAPNASNLTPSLRYECPGWLVPEMEASLGDEASALVEAMRERATVFLRVNLLKTNLIAAQKSLFDEGIETEPHPLAPAALAVLTNPRRIAASYAFQNGLVELQDAASQAVVDCMPAPPGENLKVLDYCAGGGGKSLALAAAFKTQITATDINAERMKDIPARAKRAGADIVPIAMEKVASRGPYDMVFCDAPCTGSGAWRRSPEGKWRLTPERFDAIREMQRDVLNKAVKLVSFQGALAYATCSIFYSENEGQVAWFLHGNPNWRCTFERRFSPLEGGDGFYIAYLTRM